MNQKLRLLFTISILICSLGSFAQQDSIAVDSTRFTSWGLRIGVNLLPNIDSWVSEQGSALEVIVDFRIKKNLYLAAEFGRKEYFKSEDFFDYNTQGNFAKFGINYNTYRNWLDMNNEIYVGGRLGYANFSQEVTEITNFYIGDKDDFYFPDVNRYPVDIGRSNNLNAFWLEFVLGLKVETFKNVFLGAQVSFSKILSEEQPQNFENLFVPGIGRTAVNNIGTYFSYTLSYLIPFQKK